MSYPTYVLGSVSNDYTVKQGDTVNALTITILVNGSPLDLTVIPIRIWWRKHSQKGPVVKQCEIGTGITLIDAVNGIFRVDKFTAFPVARYFADVEFNIAGDIKTYFELTLETVQDVTGNG